ncbi:hypothetical protein AAG906_026032 [Vitis piasezkii]
MDHLISCHLSAITESLEFLQMNERMFKASWGIFSILMDQQGLPQYRGNNALSIMEVGSHGSVRNRSGAVGLDSVLAHNHSHLVQGNYIGHPFQPSGNPWVDQQSGNHGSGGGTLAWNHGPALPYLHGSNISGGPTEAGNVGIQGYHDTSSGRSSTNYLQPPVLHRHHNLHYPPPPPMQGARSHFHPQVVASSNRLAPPTGIRIDRSHRGGAPSEEEYENEEKIGFLDCGHEYHADCLKKWVLVKNVCPLCKAPAMTCS